jgi:hypothetical protein
MGRLAAPAALILLLAACSAPRSQDKGNPGKAGAGKTDAKPLSGALDVAVEVEAAGASPREGELATVVFRIHNGTPNAVILRDLSLPRDLMLTGSSGAVMTWQFAQAGAVAYLPDRDEWTYEKGKRADAPRPVFNSGFLVSDESLVVRTRVRLLEMPMDFQFSFFELTADDLRRKVYFEFREPKLVRYRTLVGRELESRLLPSLRTDEAGHRFVIFPHAEPIASTTLLKTFRLQQALRPRPFRLDQASTRAGVKKPRPGEYTYSLVFDGWVVPKESGHVLVTPIGVTPLPELKQMERIFHLIDVTVPEKMTIEVRAHSAASLLGDLKYPLVKDEKEIPVTKDVKEKRITYYIFLSTEQVGRLFADLARLKLAVDVEYGESGGKLVIHTR